MSVCVVVRVMLSKSKIFSALLARWPLSHAHTRARDVRLFPASGPIARHCARWHDLHSSSSPIPNRLSMYPLCFSMSFAQNMIAIVGHVLMKLGR